MHLWNDKSSRFNDSEFRIRTPNHPSENLSETNYFHFFFFSSFSLCKLHIESVGIAVASHEFEWNRLWWNLYIFRFVIRGFVLFICFVRFFSTRNSTENRRNGLKMLFGLRSVERNGKNKFHRLLLSNTNIIIYCFRWLTSKWNIFFFYNMHNTFQNPFSFPFSFPFRSRHQAFSEARNQFRKMHGFGRKRNERRKEIRNANTVLIFGDVSIWIIYFYWMKRIFECIFFFTLYSCIQYQTLQLRRITKYSVQFCLTFLVSSVLFATIFIVWHK